MAPSASPVFSPEQVQLFDSDSDCTTLIEDVTQPMRVRMTALVRRTQREIIAAVEQLEAKAHMEELSKLKTRQQATTDGAPANPLDALISPSADFAREDPVTAVMLTSDMPAAGSDAATFFQDTWLRPEGGAGWSCVLSRGRVFEKAAVLVSVVHGQLTKSALEQMSARGRPVSPDRPALFFAAGLSLVIHPHNPHAPTAHLNYRFFEVYHTETAGSTCIAGLNPVASWFGGGADLTPNYVTCIAGLNPVASWFGGGADLTPNYVYAEDGRHFHGAYKSVLDQFDADLYPTMKRTCDDYFVNVHRVTRTPEAAAAAASAPLRCGATLDPMPHNSRMPETGPSVTHERRGIGGIFFDDMDQLPDLPGAFAMVQALAQTFVPSYLPLVDARREQASSARHRRWQQLRRARYVEFNLVHDRGTKFGLATPGARIESVLASLPLTARWEYCPPEPEPGTPEAEALAIFRQPIEWA
ncbi:hypothetical protein H696_03089 [Fonticula alba]|uniref:coproporphyrinogen oxidase n=1 Tax=Fonticula alba TaxID=691883 RepID=A0A058Z9X7_FONAL|nr:hypothetical protein H696_03089 [Fonticula alba]KCV70738.1 hypothetical protein H696_03089 [Fonticula alba]|eukprot:XP_009495254.1 hypothetical protein H696_03089 [Fonticula alba]